MVNSKVIYLAFFIYMSLMYIVATWGDKQDLSRKKILRSFVYSLSLAVYCTSWTFYGAVGTATKTGWGFLPIYLGPILLFTVGWPLVNKIIKISKSKNATSIADFVASLYEKSRRIAVLVTFIAVFAVVPYIALQLEAISSSLEAISVDTDNAQFRTFVIAAMVSFFSIVFGTQKLDVTEHHRGLMMAIAFESLIKVIAFVAVGVLVVFSLYSGPVDVVKEGTKFDLVANGPTLSMNFISQIILAFLVFMSLPRQFHVTVVENESRDDLIWSRWVFVIYLLLFSAFVIPISMAGQSFLPNDSSADMYVLELPIFMKQEWMTLLVFFGGLAAATGMIIISTIALSTMVSNDLLLPLYLKAKQYNLPKKSDLQSLVLNSRRASIILITFLGYLVYYLLDEEIPLASFGNLSFLLTVQFAPAILLGIYWHKTNKQAAFGGVVAGVFVWCLFVFIPEIFIKSAENYTKSGFMYTLQNLSSSNFSLSKFVFYSLGVNVLVYFVLAYYYRYINQKQKVASQNDVSTQSETIKVKDLKAAVANIVGQNVVEQSYENFFQGFNNQITDDSEVSTPIIQFTERLLSGSIGSSSARTMLTALLKSKGLTVNDIVILLDETSQAIRFHRRMTDATLDTISQGISVVDSNLRLVAWNKQYLKLLNYPEGMVYKGMAIEELIRYNASRGLLGDNSATNEVEKRLVHLRKGLPYRHEKSYGNSKYLQIEGNPMPDGGYVTTFMDVSHYKMIEQKLIKSENDIRFYTENSPAMLAYIDNSYDLKFANKAYINIFSSHENTIVGRNINELYEENQLNQCKPHLDSALEGKQVSFEFELDDGIDNKRFLLGNFVPDVDTKSQVVKGVFAILQDISTRRKTELELQKSKESLEIRVQERTQELQIAKKKAETANKSKTKFIADASHDLLQPFNAARLFCSLLSEKSDELPEDIRSTVNNLDHSLRSAENLLGALLDIAKIDAGGISVDKSNVSINQLFEYLKNQYKSLAAKKGLKFKVRSNDFFTFSDKKLLHRVLQNLTNNALKYTEKGGVLLTCRKQKESLEIYVIDTGSGLNNDEKELIFKDFYRLDKHVSNKQEQGLGLGLSIVDRIIKQLGHNLTIRSIPGKGSSFRLTVPMVTHEIIQLENTTITTEKQTQQVSKAKILCIDNDSRILEGMNLLVSNWGYPIRCALGRTQAYQILDDGFAPEILLVDYHLDNETGLQLIEDVFKKYQFQCPVIVITANRTEELKAEIEQGNFYLLNKPIRPAVLRSIINKLQN